MGSDFAPLDVIEKCIQHNPHGFSLAWNKGGELFTYRTMNPTEAMAKYKQLSESLNPAESAMIFHARIATHGSHKIENCHAFRHGDIAFFHNGVLSIKNRDDMTDSETFFRDYFVPAMEGVGFEFAMRMSKAILGRSNNKFAVIDKDGAISLTSGSECGFMKEQFPGLKGKIYFSNLNWKPFSSFTTGLGFNPYADVKKDKSVKTNWSQKKAGDKTRGSSSLPSCGRNQIGPKEPLSIHKGSAVSGLVESLFEERYNALTSATV